MGGRDWGGSVVQVDDMKPKPFRGAQLIAIKPREDLNALVEGRNRITAL